MHRIVTLDDFSTYLLHGNLNELKEKPKGGKRSKGADDVLKLTEIATIDRQANQKS